MRDHLRAGVAVYNAGAYHAAHDAWEERWLDHEDGTTDEQLLHGLIQYTAAVHHATNRNWAGTVGLAESGLAYLEAVPEDYRGVDVATAREYLERLAADPERVERAAPWPLVVEGEQVSPADLSDAELAIAAETVAGDEGLDVAVVERATSRLTGEGEPPEADEARSLLVGLLERPESGPTILARLAEHVQRGAAEDADVDALFE